MMDMAARRATLILLLGVNWCGVSRSAPAEEKDQQDVILLLQGDGLVPSAAAAESAWGELIVDPSGRLRWTGAIGYLVRQEGRKMGGVFRPRSERVQRSDLDRLGARRVGNTNLYLLASSVSSQKRGLESRARELESTVETLRKLTGGRPVRIVCWSASGIAARMWLQNAMKDVPYRAGTVSQVITLATPHCGLGGYAIPATRVFDRYKPLAPQSPLLEDLNDNRDLPRDVAFVSIFFQQPDALHLAPSISRRQSDWVRLTRTELKSLPPLLNRGHDGVVESVEAQLHLTRTAARYEQQTGRPVRVVPCLIASPSSSGARNVTLHTSAISHPAFFETLAAVLRAKPVAKPSPDKQQREWALLVARHLAMCRIKQNHFFASIESLQLHVSRTPQLGGKMWSWTATSTISSRVRWLRKEKIKSSLRGSFKLKFDRFHRPQQLSLVYIGKDARERRSD